MLTGHTFGVGQMLPMGYDAYNVPFAYRDRYYDSDRAMYRYADGHIYQVDPTDPPDPGGDRRDRLKAPRSLAGDRGRFSAKHQHLLMTLSPGRPRVTPQFQ